MEFESVGLGVKNRVTRMNLSANHQIQISNGKSAIVLLVKLVKEQRVLEEVEGQGHVQMITAKHVPVPVVNRGQKHAVK